MTADQISQIKKQQEAGGDLASDKKFKNEQRKVSCVLVVEASAVCQ